MCVRGMKTERLYMHGVYYLSYLDVVIHYYLSYLHGCIDSYSLFQYYDIIYTPPPPKPKPIIRNFPIHT